MDVKRYIVFSFLPLKNVKKTEVLKIVLKVEKKNVYFINFILYF